MTTTTNEPEDSQVFLVSIVVLGTNREAKLRHALDFAMLENYIETYDIVEELSADEFDWEDDPWGT